MREYLLNLTNNLIGNNKYHEIFTKITDLNEFVRYVKIDLESNNIKNMSPGTLGKIMCSFEGEDIIVNKKDFFEKITFSGNGKDMLCEIVSLYLAYTIRYRFTGEYPEVPDLEERRISLLEVTETSPKGNIGKKVRTNKATTKESDWTKEALANRKWGIKGTIIGYHDSHGLCYEVRHSDGSTSAYDPSELDVIINKTTTVSTT